MKHLRPRLTYANVMATIAVFIALGGASYAAIKLPKNSVSAKQLKRGAVTPAKLSGGAALALESHRGSRGRRAIRPQGRHRTARHRALGQSRRSRKPLPPRFGRRRQFEKSRHGGVRSRIQPRRLGMRLSWDDELPPAI